MENFPKTAHGVAKPATMEEIDLYNFGYTNPDLLRVVDPQQPEEGSPEVAPRDYILGVYDSINSYRTEIRHLHDEESTTCEIP